MTTTAAGIRRVASTTLFFREWQGLSGLNLHTPCSKAARNRTMIEGKRTARALLYAVISMLEAVLRETLCTY